MKTYNTKDEILDAVYSACFLVNQHSLQSSIATGDCRMKIESYKGGSYLYISWKSVDTSGTLSESGLHIDLKDIESIQVDGAVITIRGTFDCTTNRCLNMRQTLVFEGSIVDKVSYNLFETEVLEETTKSVF